MSLPEHLTSKRVGSISSARADDPSRATPLAARLDEHAYPYIPLFNIQYQEASLESTYSVHYATVFLQDRGLPVLRCYGRLKASVCKPEILIAPKFVIDFCRWQTAPSPRPGRQSAARQLVLRSGGVSLYIYVRDHKERACFMRVTMFLVQADLCLQ